MIQIYLFVLFVFITAVANCDPVRRNSTLLCISSFSSYYDLVLISDPVKGNQMRYF